MLLTSELASVGFGDWEYGSASDEANKAAEAGIRAPGHRL